MEFISALFQYEFLQHAIWAALISGIVCGVTGSFIVVKRISLIAGGIAHAVFGGVGLAYYLAHKPEWIGVRVAGWLDGNPIAGAFVFAIGAAILIGWVKLKARQHEDTIISAIWAMGMATGVILMSLTPGYNADLMSFLFGDLLMVSTAGLRMVAVLTLFVTVTVIIFYRQFLALCFDQEFAGLRGIRVIRMYILLLVLIALTVVVMIQVVGLILVIALLTLPAAIAGRFSHSFGKMILLAIGLTWLLTIGGLALSYRPNLPAGPTIILLSGVAYFIALKIGKR